jgi:hypothetical protein
MGKQEEHVSNSRVAIPDNAYLSYYRDDVEDTGGLKVKWKIRVATGPEATRLDARQTHAIRELLIWATQQQHR